MISINDALQLVKTHSLPFVNKTYKPVEKAGSYLLAENIIAPINMPPFRQSAMDGYALNIHDNLNYQIIGEIKAGDDTIISLKKGEAVRIFTGAAVPDTANAVIMQEKVILNGSEIIIQEQISINSNIRNIGEQVKKNEIALKKGINLTPAAIGFLSSLGIQSVSVLKKPSIALVTTGNELIESGKPLEPGKIYESNSKMLLSALYKFKFYDVSTHTIEDHFKATYLKIEEILNNHDFVIISGGISVGDYDFVQSALEKLQVKTLFYKVNQKPGKPLYFGTKNNKLIFALPGNPAAALTCFYLYVYPALQQMMQNPEIELPRIRAKSTSKFSKIGDRPQFLKAYYTNGTVEILEGQSSAMLQTFAISNALVFVPNNVSQIKIGDKVETILLPI